MNWTPFQRAVLGFVVVVCAASIAGALGVRLGSAVLASEQASFYGSAGMNYAPLYRAARMAEVAKTPLEPGLTKVSAQVQVVYSIR